MAKKDKKNRSDNYEEKLAINGTFSDVIKVSVKPLPKRELKPESAKKNAKKK